MHDEFKKMLNVPIKMDSNPMMPTQSDIRSDGRGVDYL